MSTPSTVSVIRNILKSNKIARDPQHFEVGGRVIIVGIFY